MYACDLATAKRAILEKYPEFADSCFEPDYPYVGYRLIEGRFLTKDVFISLAKEDKRRTLDCMAEFLNILHSVDYTVLNLTVAEPKEKYKNFYCKIQEVCFPYFDDELKELTVGLFENFLGDPTMHDYVPTLVHGDLSEDHILITENGVGIIDFGDLMVFDPAYDFIWAYLCDIDFYQELIHKYEGNKDVYFEHRIRDFHMIRPPYDGIIYADETGDRRLLEKELRSLKHNLKKAGNQI